MTGRDYVILGYCIALGLMWGYASLIWLKWRRLQRAAGPVPSQPSYPPSGD